MSVATIKRVMDDRRREAYQRLVLGMGPLAYWGYGRVGDMVPDLSGNGYHLTVHESETNVFAAKDSAIANSNRKSAIYMNQGYAKIAAFPSVQEVTVSLWTLNDVAQNSVYLFHTQYWTSGWYVKFDGSIGPLMMINADGLAKRVNHLQLGLWHHTVFTLDSSGINIYIDGENQPKQWGRSGTTEITPFTGALYLGADSTNNRAITTVDQPVVFDRVLTPDQILALYKTAKG